jgi:hypothetical protein
VISLHVELIATDGKIQKRILWVSVTSNGVYSGYCWKDRAVYISYHFDGNVFTHWSDGKPKKTATLPSLRDLDDSRQLYSTAFSSNLSRMHDIPVYNLKKLDAIVNVDTRSHERGIGVNLFIIPQNRFDLVGKVIRFPPSNNEAHFFFDCNPWIGLVLYGNVYEKAPAP